MCATRNKDCRSDKRNVFFCHSDGVLVICKEQTYAYNLILEVKDMVP